MSIDGRVHRRFLDYLDLHVYFSRKTPLNMSAFAEKDTTFFALKAKGDKRDDEEESSFIDLSHELHRD